MEEERVQLLDRIPIELTFHMASFLDLQSMARFLRTCRSLWDLRMDQSLISALDPLIVLEERKARIHRQSTALAEERFQNNSLLGEYTAFGVFDRDNDTPFLVVKGSITHKEAVKRGYHIAKGSIITHTELCSHIDGENGSPTQVLDNAYFEGNCMTMVKDNGKLKSASLMGKKDPIDELRDYGIIVLLNGTGSLASTITHELAKRIERGEDAMARTVYLGDTINISFFMEVELLVVSPKPIPGELESLVVDVSKEISAMSCL